MTMTVGKRLAICCMRSRPFLSAILSLDDTDLSGHHQTTNIFYRTKIIVQHIKHTTILGQLMRKKYAVKGLNSKTESMRITEQK